MKKYWLVCAASILFPSLAVAGQPGPLFGVQASYVGNDAGRGSDFASSGRVEAFGGFRLTPNVAVEAGASYSAKTEDSGGDNQGTYTIGITSNDVYAGLRLDSPPMGRWNLYGRGGFLYYDSVIDFREDFYGIKPGGSLRKTESGTGYYVEGGVAFAVAPNMKLQAGISHRVRQDYFGHSLKPFDMTENGVSVAMVWQY